LATRYHINNNVDEDRRPDGVPKSLQSDSDELTITRGSETDVLIKTTEVMELGLN